MEFSDNELIVIYILFDSFIDALENKKRKNKDEIITLNQMKKINKKIDKYMEEKEKWNMKQILNF